MNIFILLSLILFLAFSSSTAQNQGFKLNLSPNLGLSSDIDQASDRSIFITSLGPSAEQDSFVILSKFNSNNELNWSRAYTSFRSPWRGVLELWPEQNAMLFGIRKDQRTGLIRLDENGNVVWAKKYGGDSEQSNLFHINQPVISNDEMIYLAGGNSDGSIGVRAYYLLLSKIDVNGELIWGKRYNFTPLQEPGNILLRDFIETNDGSFIFLARSFVAFSGMILMKVNPDGDILFAKEIYLHEEPNQAGRTIDPKEIVELSNGNLIVVGEYSSLPRRLGIILKLSADGSLIEERVLEVDSSTNDLILEQIIRQENDDLIIAGVDHSPDEDLQTERNVHFIFKIKDNFEIVWSKAYHEDNNRSGNLIREFSQLIELDQGGFSYLTYNSDLLFRSPLLIQANRNGDQLCAVDFPLSLFSFNTSAVRMEEDLVIETTDFSTSEDVEITVTPYDPGFSLPSLALGQGTTFCEKVLLNMAIDSIGAVVFGAESYTWNTGDTTAIIPVEEFGTYWVDVQSDSLCYSLSDTIRLNQKCPDCKLKVPNAFTPNQDDLNDIFQPLGLCLVSEYSFQVFSRWGELLFETNQFGEGGDGTFNGEAVPSDVYIWTLRYRVPSEDMTFFSESGDVTLLR